MSSLVTPHTPPLGQFVEVNGRRMLLHRSDAGGPTVVFLPGAGLVGLDFLNIHEAICGFATSVLYDRSGTGWSDDIALPRSAGEVASELRALLAKAGAPAPYILVGHSLGGAYVRRYAQLFPDDVAGMLFLDPAHEGYLSSPKPALTSQLRQLVALLPALLNLRKFYRPMFAAMLAAWPQPLRTLLVDYHLGAWRKSLQEAKNLSSEVLGEIRDGGAMPDRPLIVLSAMGIDPFMAAFADRAYLRELNAFKAGVYRQFAASARRGDYRQLDDAGHSTIHTDRPDAVVAAIGDLVAQATAERPLLLSQPLDKVG